MVTLRNLKINGLLGNGRHPGSDGIRVIGGGAAVHIENVTIQGFAQQGIDFAPSSTVDLFVRDTIISNNQGGGIAVAPSGAAGARVSLSNVRLDQNGASGLSVTKASGVFAAITIEDTNIEKNGIGVRASGASAFIHLKRLDSRSQRDRSPNSDRRKNQLVREQCDLPQQRRRRADQHDCFEVALS